MKDDFPIPEGNWTKYYGDRYLDEWASEENDGMHDDIYTTEEFTPHGRVTSEVIQYVLDNVEDFHHRYSEEMYEIGRTRRPLDRMLLGDIYDAVCDFLFDDEDDEIHDIDGSLWEEVEDVFE